MKGGISMSSDPIQKYFNTKLPAAKWTVILFMPFILCGLGLISIECITLIICGYNAKISVCLI